MIEVLQNSVAMFHINKHIKIWHVPGYARRIWKRLRLSVKDVNTLKLKRKNVIKALVKFDHEFSDRDNITRTNVFRHFPNPIGKSYSEEKLHWVKGVVSATGYLITAYPVKENKTCKLSFL